MFGLFMYCFVSQQQIAFGQLKACPWLVQSAVYFSHINDPNDNSGGGGVAVSLNIPLMVSRALNLRLLHSNTTQFVSQFLSLSVPFGGMHRLRPLLSHLPCPCPLPPLPL